jgi:predicted ATPase
MISTNWYVITGGPSSGKTTLIEQLTKKGFQTAPEIARHCIEELLKSHSLKEIQNNAAYLQHTILQQALEREKNLTTNDVRFFDRGIIDSLGYYSYYHLDIPDNLFNHPNRALYKKVFFCQQLPITHDKVRVEDNSMARDIGNSIHLAYEQLDYELIELPPVNVEARLEIILGHVAE